LGVVPKLRRCLRSFVDVLREERLLLAAGDRLRCAFGCSPRPSIDERSRLLQDRYPSFSGLIDLVAHCGRHLAESLSPEYGGLQTLYPGGSDARIRASIDDTVS